jgi:hypothetical protein
MEALSMAVFSNSFFRGVTSKFIPRGTPICDNVYGPENKVAVGSGRRLVQYCQWLDRKSQKFQGIFEILHSIS